MSFWPPYVTVEERKKKAAKKVASLKKNGKTLYPVIINSRTIARTFWGKSWCKHLESYSDYENRLPRGRSYVRNSSVIDLQIKKGLIDALVCGSSMYDVTVEIQELHASKWQNLIKECSGKIDSLIELLQGKFSKSIMEIITNKDNGLFPNPNEIKLKCSCPDRAYMCKHIAAVLYGIGARLDDEPEKLFLLRHVDHLDLFDEAQSSGKIMSVVGKGDTEMDDESLSSLFGIEIDKKSKDAKSIKKPSKKIEKKKPETKKPETKKSVKKKQEIKKPAKKQAPKKTKKKSVVKKTSVTKKPVKNKK
jgi:uncharacterized Zn finger protein